MKRINILSNNPHLFLSFLFKPCQGHMSRVGGGCTHKINNIFCHFPQGSRVIEKDVVIRDNSRVVFFPKASFGPGRGGEMGREVKRRKGKKERKRKERKGKERKGKERKGKEKKRKES